MDITEPTATTEGPGPVPRVRSRHHPLFGGLLIKEGLINQAQLDRALARQQETEPRPLLGQIFLDQKLVTPHELNAVLAKYQRTHLLGDVLVETKAITPAELESALATQRKTHGPLGETLVQLGLITERALKHALSIQLRIPLVDLDDRSVDPDMAAVISERYARHHRVLPLVEVDGRVVLAMDDPTDVEVVAEIRACTGRRIDVVVVTVDALERAFSRLYGERGDGTSVRRSSTEADDTGTRPSMPETTRVLATAAPSLPTWTRAPIGGTRSGRGPGVRSTPSAPGWTRSATSSGPGIAGPMRPRRCSTSGASDGSRSTPDRRASRASSGARSDESRARGEGPGPREPRERPYRPAPGA